MGSSGADAHIGLGKERVSGIFREAFDSLHPFRSLNLAGSADAALGVVTLHLRFLLEGVDAVELHSGLHIEVGAQACIALKPAFVVRLYPVDASVFPCKIAHGAVHLVVVAEVADGIILGQRIFQLCRKRLIGCITDAQDPDSVFLQFIAKLPILFRKVWRNKDKVYHNEPIILCVKPILRWVLCVPTI